jgi:hypothetical protein
MKLKRKIKLILAIIFAGISVIAFALVILFWAGVIVTANFNLSSMIYIFAGIFIIPACIYILVRQRQKIMSFCLVYKYPRMKKHEPEVMRVSFIKYLLVIFILTFASTFPLGVFIVPMLAVYAVVAHCIFKYARLWKYHGYSLLLLLTATAGAVAAAVMLSLLF